MKRTLIAIVAAAFVATGANAASFSVDTDKSSYLVGETITVTVTVDVGSEVVPFFGSYALQVGWDDTVADGPSNSAQNPVLAGLSGSTTPTCAVSGIICTIVTQVNASAPGGVAVGPAQIIGTLELTAIDLGSVALAITGFQNLTATDPSVVDVGTNFASATVVPEPTTAALLGLGLLGLGMAGRRR